MNGYDCILKIPIKKDCDLNGLEKVCGKRREKLDAVLDVPVTTEEIALIFSESDDRARRAILRVFQPGFDNWVADIMKFVEQHLPLVGQTKLKEALQKRRDDIYKRSQ